MNWHHFRPSPKPTVQNWALGKIVEGLDPGRILEVGCGSGITSGALKELGLDVECADVDRWHDPRPHIHHTSGADLTRALPFPNGAFQTVVSLEVLEHVTNPFNAVEQLARILRDGGQLILTLPNFWSVRARWRFFWRGSLNRSRARDRVAQANLRAGHCPPHITTLPWPTLKYALAAYGMRVEDVVGSQRNVLPHLPFLPLAAAIWAVTRLSGRRQRERFELDEANRWSVLFGSHHVFIRARKIGVDDPASAADAPAQPAGPEPLSS